MLLTTTTFMTEIHIFWVKCCWDYFLYIKRQRDFFIWSSGRQRTSCEGEAGLGADHAQRKCDNSKIAWEGMMMRQQNILWIKNLQHRIRRGES